GVLPRSADGRLLLAVVVSSWLRPGAATSPGRLFCHVCGRGKGQAQMIPGWPYSVIAALEPGCTSWTAVLDALMPPRQQRHGTAEDPETARPRRARRSAQTAVIGSALTQPPQRHGPAALQAPYIRHPRKLSGYRPVRQLPGRLLRPPGPADCRIPLVPGQFALEGEAVADDTRADWLPGFEQRCRPSQNIPAPADIIRQH